MKAGPGIRAVLLHEFRSAALQETAGLLLILILFLAIERWKVSSGQVLDQIRPAMDAALLAVVALWGFATGARCFSEDLKRRRFLYLYSLPLSRSRLWIALAAGRLTAGLVSLAALLLVRPSLLQEIRAAREDISLALPWLLALYFVLLAAGLCFSQVFQRTITACLVGYPVVLTLLFQVLGYLSDGVPRSSIWQRYSTLAGLGAGSLLLSLALSWAFFVKGENALTRRSLINQISLAMTLSGALIAVGAVSRLASPEGSWLPASPRHDSKSTYFPTWPFRPVSSEGRYLAVVERRHERPGHWRVHVIETATGRVVGAWRWRELKWAGWSGQGDILQVVISPASFLDPWAVSEPEATWIRLDPAGKELSRHRLGVFLMATSLADGTTLLLDRQDTEDRLLRMEDDGRTILLTRFSSPESAQFIISLRRYGALLTIEDGPRRSWHIEGPRAHELENFSTWPFLSLAGDGPVEKEMSHLFGLPSEGFSLLTPGQGDSLILSRTASVFALRRQGQTVSFLMRRRGSSGWAQLSAGLSSDRFFEIEQQRRSPGWGLTRSDYPNIRADQAPRISFLDGLALYLPTGGADGRAALYDSALDREIPLPACQGKAAFPELISARDEHAWLVRFQCVESETVFHHFYYLPGSGQPKALPALDRELGWSPILLAYLDEQTAIWRPEKGETWKILRDGQIRTLWPPRPPLD